MYSPGLSQTIGWVSETRAKQNPVQFFQYRIEVEYDGKENLYFAVFPTSTLPPTRCFGNGTRNPLSYDRSSVVPHLQHLQHTTFAHKRSGFFSVPVHCYAWCFEPYTCLDGFVHLGFLFSFFLLALAFLLLSCFSCSLFKVKGWLFRKCSRTQIHLLLMPLEVSFIANECEQAECILKYGLLSSLVFFLFVLHHTF